jgi:integrase/recombinase XerD
VKAPKVRLYFRVRVTRGKYSFQDPAWNRNRTLRAAYALVDGQPQHHPEGVYYLRYMHGRKRVWHAVGTDGDAALVALTNKEHDLQAVRLGRSAPEQCPDQPVPVMLDSAIESYLAEIRRSRSAKTIAACSRILGVFGSRFPGRSLDRISREDLLDNRAALQHDGLSPRTIYNHVMRINSFLRSQGITGLLKPGDKPTYDEPEVEAYDSDQLESLFGAADDQERLLFEFFLATGFRDQEVMYCTWKNVDFNGKVIMVRSKPELGFRPKDKEERSVPVPDALIDRLALRRRASACTFVFPGKNGKPDGHLLRTLQRLAHRAGLNCGECKNKKGRICSTSPICSGWRLHKFRRTFATMHAEAGVPAPTIQRWLGHSDLATTLRYLAIADVGPHAVPKQIVTDAGRVWALARQPNRSISIVTQCPRAVSETDYAGKL